MQSEVGLVGHDQLFKQLLQAFFADFLRLFDPDTAAALDLDTVTFVNPETFTDIPQGERRTADLVARVRTIMWPACATSIRRRSVDWTMRAQSCWSTWSLRICP